MHGKNTERSEARPQLCALRSGPVAARNPREAPDELPPSSERKRVAVLGEHFGLGDGQDARTDAGGRAPARVRI